MSSKGPDTTAEPTSLLRVSLAGLDAAVEFCRVFLY